MRDSHIIEQTVHNKNVSCWNTCHSGVAFPSGHFQNQLKLKTSYPDMVSDIGFYWHLMTFCNLLQYLLLWKIQVSGLNYQNFQETDFINDTTDMLYINLFNMQALFSWKETVFDLLTILIFFFFFWLRVLGEFGLF